MLRLNQTVQEFRAFSQPAQLVFRPTNLATLLGELLTAETPRYIEQGIGRGFVGLASTTISPNLLTSQTCSRCLRSCLARSSSALDENLGRFPILTRCAFRPLAYEGFN